MVGSLQMLQILDFSVYVAYIAFRRESNKKFSSKLNAFANGKQIAMERESGKRK